ncbi:hypothetical protein ACOQFL_15645 [Actinopolyspora sp. H202]|uniref:hypothetical protein n=1 Tax=Actinopolyspora sp. H202 TaxID=1500456 RepID=UPI003EE5067B
MPDVFPVLVLAVLFAATAIVLGVWGHYSERRPRHAGAGPGALTVAQLREEIETMPEQVRADAALTEIMPALGRGRWSRWRGTLPLSAVTKRRPGSTNLPGRPTEDNPIALDGADPDLLARVLAGLRAL